MNICYEPLKCKPIYKQMIWGSESWQLSCRPNDFSKICTGTYKDKTIEQVFLLDKEGFLGNRFKNADNFPLLIKIIDANDDLSVQVHPNDDYAKTFDVEPLGKTECWYVLHAPENAQIIIGLNQGVDRQSFSDAIHNGTVNDCIRKIPVKTGDIFDIQPGTVHAITKGLKIYEVQQNSNITYRVYDYDRIDKNGNKRELHIQKAKDVINYNCYPNCVTSIKNNYFTLNKLDIKTGFYSDTTSVDQFSILTIIKGSCEIVTEQCKINMLSGETIFLPAKMGKYDIKGICEILVSNP